MGQCGVFWGTSLAFLLFVLVLFSVKRGLAFDDDNNQWVISSSDTNINYNYKDALDKAIMFFEGQRSGKLPTNQRVNWRGDSALSDGNPKKVDLVGGYYDAGDNVKFGWPMAFSVSLLSWAAIEYRAQISSANQLNHLQDAIRWGTDFILKAHTSPTTLYTQVGDGNADHQCWERPEDMDTSRALYKITSTSPGTEVAAEAAAALAAASILFEFADKYRGSYQGSCPFYCSYSGYQEFYGGKKELEKYKSDIESFVCAIMPGSSSQQIKTTPGGLLYIRDSSNLQYVTTSTMVLSIYANTLNSAHIGGTVQCGSTKFSPSQITAFAKSQVDYILGNNPMKTSYMVGFGNKYPTQLHHRGSSIPSLRTHQAKVSCNEGQTLYFPSTKPNPNVHVGALVGGPNSNDQFNDVRSDYSHLEPSTYINAAFVGSVAPFIAQNHLQQQPQSSLVIMQKSN
ncbi:hypothetical protein CsatB_004605 [Cannabis sativa]